MTYKKYNKIYCIGDSHANTLHGAPNITSIAFGPNTMHHIGKHGVENMLNYLYNTKEVIKEELFSENGLLILAYGEIDVRCHIDKQIVEKQREEDEVIKTLVDSYINQLKLIPTNMGVLSVVPPIKFFSVDSSKIEFNITYPFVGPDLDRNRYTQKLNEYLHQRCIEENIIYIDVYNPYKDEEGFLIKELSDGNVHIYNRDKIKDILTDIGLM
jgi:hypothetical protein